MRRAVAALILFGISFGYVEAAVVVYLRAIYDPIRARLHPERAFVRARGLLRHHYAATPLGRSRGLIIPCRSTLHSIT